MASVDLFERLQTLSESACYEASQGEELAARLRRSIYHAAYGGGTKPLLKVLLSNACENNCAYCANRASAAFTRSALRPEELARGFEEMLRRGQVQGLFLSSGLCGNAVRTMDRLLDTVEIVRKRIGFRGYIHLKIMPGAGDDQIERAGLLADRISANLEAPSADRLGVIAPDKRFSDLLGILGKVRVLRDALPAFAPAGPTTQFVAGAAGESDRELLHSAGLLYRSYGLSRVYFSGFRPVPGSPLAEAPAMPEERQRRLYQADALLRSYGFSAAELPYDEEGQLAGGADPKLLWATQHPECFPVELNSASRAQLLRVPGIGPLGAERLLAARRRERLRSLSQLQRLGLLGERCAPFVLLDGKRPDFQPHLPSIGTAA